MEKLPISICILSWKTGKTLKNTLKSYSRFGLLNMTEDIVILFQEVNEEDKKLADQYKIRYIGLQDNIGIGKGMKMLAENAVCENILFLEHDWELIEDQNTVFTRLAGGLKMLDNGFDVIRYRSRENPGYPLISIRHKGNELDYYDDWHECTSPHLLESLHWLDPAVQFPDKIQKQGEYFITTSRWANWTNNPYLVKKSFLLETIIPFSGETASLERNIAAWWVKQTFRIAQGEGLFMHNDLTKYPKRTIIQKILGRLKNKFK
ncbi:hypothetical protein [Chryseobacterium sp. G0186]|uniref:hypothetical protein n=1 Tax=Chryseobacterium sp. G0186 TaxID=2487064 RepID=UPI000F4DC2DC|nr:hypothetical protein [Chryseobacterium sp. G0186]